MRKEKLILLALPLLLLQQAGAQDLESLLDEGAKTSQASSAVDAPAKTTPLSQAIKKILGTPSSEQNIFLRFLENAEWEKAVLQYPAAFAGTPFQKSATGRALQGYLQFQAGLPITGVQTLFLADKPAEINATLREEWMKLAPVEHFAWDLAQVPWTPAWEQVFGERLEMRMKTLAALQAGTPDLEALQKLSAQAQNNSKEKGLLDWQLVLGASLQDQADRAAKLLANLMKSKNSPVREDLMQLTAARLLYQNGYFSAALKYYEKLPKTSEYWTEAQEEMGWAYIRKGEPQNALALSQTLVASDLNYQVSPEAFFVRALAQLKVCDYTGVTETLKSFPKRFKERTQRLSELSQNSTGEATEKALGLLTAKRIQQKDLGKAAQNLPRRLARDEKLYQFVQAQKYWDAEAQAAEKLYAKSLALTGLQGVLDSLKQSTLQKAQAAKNAAYGRVKDLATEEVNETREILRKLHIVEAELLQQLSMADRIAKNAKGQEEKKGVTGYKGSADVVSFPAEDELWFDELSNYRVDVKKACTVKR